MNLRSDEGAWIVGGFGNGVARQSGASLRELNRYAGAIWLDNGLRGTRGYMS